MVDKTVGLTSLRRDIRAHSTWYSLFLFKFFDFSVWKVPFFCFCPIKSNPSRKRVREGENPFCKNWWFWKQTTYTPPAPPACHKPPAPFSRCTRCLGKGAEEEEGKTTSPLTQYQKTALHHRVRQEAAHKHPEPPRPQPSTLHPPLPAPGPNQATSAPSPDPEGQSLS